jgi:hypothetical protein
MKNGRKNNKAHSQVRYYLYWLCMAWMAAQMLLILWKFLELPIPIIIPASFPAYYLVLLLIYTIVRASARWAHKAIPRKRGGIFVFLWGVFALLLLLVRAFSNGRFEIPSVTLYNFVIVSSVYAASRIEKRLYLNSRKKLNK